ncbi:MAG: HAD hydrolase-like protein, partial [Clostridia bacterium]|nr:HAD hydrolase-like protein [Clostridia bacterium]
VQSYGLKDYFIHILGQKGNAAECKAHLAHKLKELTDCKPGEVLFIGDTVHDYEVAKEAGFDCALVANGHCSRSRLEATGAPVYGNLTELYEAVFK